MKRILSIFLAVLMMAQMVPAMMSAAFAADCTHSWKNGDIIKEATCTTTGTRQKVCDLCGATKTAIISTLGHSTESLICTVAQKKDMVCTRCGVLTRTNVSVSVSEGAAESHVFTESLNNTSPNCTENGEICLECKYCGKEDITEIPALGHSYSYSDDFGKYVCTICGRKALLGDVNSDGKVTNSDALEIFKYIFNQDTYPIEFLGLADVNSDGDINNVDALHIFKYIYDPELYPLETSEVSLVIDGTDISLYTIVYNEADVNGEKALAEKLALHVYNYYGAELTVSSSWNGEGKAIVIGDSSYVTSAMKSRIEAYSHYKLGIRNAMIASYDNVLWLAASNSYTVKAAVDKLIEMTTPTTNGQHLLHFATEKTALSVEVDDLGDELKVMSYNVQTGNPAEPRISNMIGNITSFMPDIIGMQEVNAKWIEQFEAKGLFDTYTFVGEPRNGNKDTDKTNGNEYSAIMFKTDKFKLIDYGTYWLSDTPTVPGSMHSSSDYIRIMTYVVLERKSDGKRLVHVNTHLEWDHGEIKTNLIQINIMQELVKNNIYSEYGELPTYYTGDFNVYMTSDGYKYMISSGHSDARYEAETSTNENTFSGETIIDYCFVSNGDFLVEEFDVGYGLAGSDHYPVYVRMYLN